MRGAYQSRAHNHGGGSVSSSDGGHPPSSLLTLSPRDASGGGGGSGHGGSGILAEALRTAAAAAVAAGGGGAAGAGGTAAAFHPSSSASSSARAARANWQRALAAAVAASRHGGYLADPWGDRRLAERCPARLAVRHRYDAGAERWTVDTVLIKMESRPFAAGAMRCCLRLKKLSAASRARGSGIKPLEWKSAPNFVAKVFKKPGTPDSAYFGKEEEGKERGAVGSAAAGSRRRRGCSLAGEEVFYFFSLFLSNLFYRVPLSPILLSTFSP